MAELRSQDKRDKLRLIYAQCKPTAKSLEDALLDALNLCDAAINGPTPGTFLSSSQEAGGGASFQMLQDYTPTVARRLIGELMDARDKAEEDLTRSTGDEPDDAAIYSHMMRNSLASIRKFRTDFTGGRYGVGFHLGT